MTLQKVLELPGEDFVHDYFELGPPAMPIEEYSKKVCPQSKLCPPPSPLWPRTPPSLAQLEERNTFLNFYDSNCTASPCVSSRRRALSDFTGSCTLALQSKEILQDF